jgi:hypothetical protein
MFDLSCPWCETDLGVTLEVEGEEQTCPECLTTWSYEQSTEVALAA